jgi:hypothetical protein
MKSNWSPLKRSTCGKTYFGEFVCVAVAHFDFNPIFFDCFVYPSSKISISHLDKIIASKCTARANFMFRKDSEDLASDFLIRLHFSHFAIPRPVESEDRSDIR